MSDEKYQKLELQEPISEELEDAINVLMDHINNGDRCCEDCYRTEIYCCLKYEKNNMSKEQYDTLKEYYVFGGIYENCEAEGEK